VAKGITLAGSNPRGLPGPAGERVNIHPAPALWERYSTPLMRDAAVTIYGTWLMRRRRSGSYSQYLARHRSWRKCARSEVEAWQKTQLAYLLENSRRSKYYASVLPESTSTLDAVPILEKEALQTRINDIVIPGPRLTPCFTGGTTGRGIVVYNNRDRERNRIALTDSFWEMHGFTLGRERAGWFSGRRLISERDERRNVYWRTNWLGKIRYYSTFHMSQANLAMYVANLNSFRPAVLCGFPSAIAELADYILASATRLHFRARTVFVTSETISQAQREKIARAFGCVVRTYYASSEGAPAILECPMGRLHMDLATGIFEVVGEDGRPGRDGEVLVTSFLVWDTPLIRYRIGDRISLSDEQECPCGWDTPIVSEIQGRTADHIVVPGRGPIFASQIGDCVKDVTSIRRFQVYMLNDAVHVDLCADIDRFERSDKEKFLHKLQERVGDVEIFLHYREELPRTASGKHSVVRGNG
jgi:phenylacetate-CoA ligase